MKKVSLAELIGKKAKKKELDLDDLEDLLGDRMPEMEYSPRGRLRLTEALRKRFGDNYRNIRGMSGIMKKFDEEVKFNVKMAEMKMIRGRKGNK